MTQAELRARILKITYDAYRAGNLPLQIPDYVRTLEIEHDDHATVDISNGIGYLVDRSAIDAKRIDALGRRFPLWLVLQPTAEGIDAVEAPERHPDVIAPHVVNIFQGPVGIGNVAGGTVIYYASPFPAGAIRDALEEDAESQRAIDQLEEELSAPATANASIVLKAVGTLKTAADAVGGVRELAGWLSDPNTQHFITAMTAKLLGS